MKKHNIVGKKVKRLDAYEKVTGKAIYGDDIYHYDTYNKTIDEFISLGFLEELDKKGVHFVEWGDIELEKILREYRFDILTIDIKKIKNRREYIVES